MELGYCISDDALITSAMHYRYFEYDLLDMRERKIRAIDSHYRDTIFAYQKTIDYIDELLPLLYKRDFVKYTLLDKKSYLLLNQYIDKKELYQLALENYLSYRKAIKKEAAEWEIAHKYAVKDLGDLIFQQSSDIKKTESIYNLGLNRHFLSYEKDKESLNKMKEIYIEIAKANINLHSGNLAELSRKTIPDSLTNVLFPYLQSEIEAAGGNFQEYLESAGYLINHPDYKRRTKKDKQKGKR